VIGPAPAAPPAEVDDDTIAGALAPLLAGGDTKAAVAAVTASLRVPRRRVYSVAVRLKNPDGQRKGTR
jgi:hypothetical protein